MGVERMKNSTSCFVARNRRESKKRWLERTRKWKEANKHADGK